MNERKKMSDDDVHKLQVSQQADQIEAWARDNKDLLLDIFINDDDVTDEEYSDCLTHAMSWGLAQVLKDRQTPFYDEEKATAEGKKIVKRVSWKKVSLFLFSLFADEIIETLELIKDGEVVEDELSMNIASACIMAILSDCKDKKMKFEDE